MSDIDEAGVLAEQLREIASELEAGSANCRVWADLKGHNRHCERLAAPLVYRALILNWYSGLSCPGTLGIIADPRYGTINWGAVRKKLEIHTLRWLDEYDHRDAPPKRLIQVRAIKPSEWNQVMGYEELGEPGDFQEEVFRRVEEDRTADELRQWYKEQGLAWASTLETLAGRIDTTSEQPEDKESWQKAIDALKSHEQRVLAKSLKQSRFGMTYYEMLDIDGAFSGSRERTESAAKMKAKRINECWASEKPPIPWAIERVNAGSIGKYGVTKKNFSK